MYKTLHFIGWNYHKWQPIWLKKITGTNAYVIHRFVKRASENMRNKLILDAGAGNTRPYKHLFEDKNYHSTDIVDDKKTHTFQCNLESIPVENNFYDGILCTETLEHIRDYNLTIS